jgi:hypothetical protein
MWQGYAVSSRAPGAGSGKGQYGYYRMYENKLLRGKESVEKE